MEADRWIVVADRFGEQEVLGLAETWQEAVRVHLRHAWANRDPHRKIRILPNPAAVARALEWGVSPYELARQAEESVKNPGRNT